MNKIILSRQNAYITQLFYELQKHFDKKFVDVRRRFSINSDLHKWLPEIEYFWKQTKNENPNFYEVCFDDTYVCTLTDKMSVPMAVIFIIKNLIPLIKNNEIFLEEWKFIEKVEKKKEQEKREKQKQVEQIKKDWENANLSQLNEDERVIFNEYSKELLENAAK